MGEQLALEQRWPAAITPELDRVLGLLHFQTAPIAHLFRKVGHDIPRKIEREHAFVLFWLIGLVLKHGDKWGDAYESEVAALQARASAPASAPAEEGAPKP